MPDLMGVHSFLILFLCLCGTLAPKREVSGNVHVALGKSVQRDGKLVHEFNIEDIGCETALKQFLWVFGCMVQQNVSEKQIKHSTGNKKTHP